MGLRGIRRPLFRANELLVPAPGRVSDAAHPASRVGRCSASATSGGLLQRLSPNERRRRLWHMLPGFLPFSWWILPHSVPLSLTWQVSLCLLAIVMSLATCGFGKSFVRPEEPNCWCSFISYVSMVLTPVLLFPWHPEFSATVLAVLAFGDGSAALGGMLLRGPKLPWNHDKTWAGSICFLIGSVPMATLYFWGETGPSVTWPIAFLFAGSAALAGDIVESLPLKMNDNVRVGLAANLMLIAMQTLVLGWTPG